MLEPGKKYDVFVNYNSRDFPFVIVLVERLKMQGISCFLDRWHTRAGKNAITQLMEGIKESSIFVAFVGKYGIGPWQKWEIDTALEEGIKKHCIIPVLSPDVSSEEMASVASSLAVKTRVSFENHLDEEPPFDDLLKAIKEELKEREPDRKFTQESDNVTERNRRNPYKGLRAFLDQDHKYFFGRQKATQKIIDNIEKAISDPKKARLFVLTGVSGCGKSSLARAGVMAELRKTWGKKWRYVTVIPREKPLRSLTEKISVAESDFQARLLEDKSTLNRQISQIMGDTGEGKFVLLIDQFEEVFTLREDERECRAFIDNLLFAACKDDGKGVIILTLRNEFLQNFIDAVDEESCNGKAYLCRKESIEPVTSLDDSELHEIIVKPAHLKGVGYDLALIETLRKEASKMRKDKGMREGILPLLQVALEKLWQYRYLNQIRYESYKTYEETNGIRGVLEKHADDIYQAFGEAQRRIVQRIFLNLIHINSDTPDEPETRQRATFKDIAVNEDEAEIRAFLI